MYACVCAHMHTKVVCMHGCTCCTCVCTCTCRTCAFACTCTRIRVRACACVHVHACMCMRACACVCMPPRGGEAVIPMPLACACVRPPGGAKEVPIHSTPPHPPGRLKMVWDEHASQLRPQSPFGVDINSNPAMLRWVIVCSPRYSPRPLPPPQPTLRGQTPDPPPL